MSINNGDLELTGIDLGGHRQIRRVWQDYFEAVDVVVFMIDAADIQRLGQSIWSYPKILNTLNPQLEVDFVLF